MPASPRGSALTSVVKNQIQRRDSGGLTGFFDDTTDDDGSLTQWKALLESGPEKVINKRRGRVVSDG